MTTKSHYAMTADSSTSGKIIKLLLTQVKMPKDDKHIKLTFGHRYNSSHDTLFGRNRQNDPENINIQTSERLKM